MSTKTIKIKVDKSGAQRALSEVNKQLGNVGLRAEIGAGAFTGMAGKAAIAASSVAAVGAAALIASKKMLDLARSSALVVTEMSRNAGLAQLSTDEFQAMAYAANTVGVSQQKLGDILKDVNDKLGDFIATGGGEFKDVFETALQPMGITIEQLKEMSSSQVLVAVQQGMEATGRSGKEMTFVLESIANDAALLAPLLENNAKQMKRLDAEVRNLGLIIPPDQVKAAKEFNDKFVTLTAQFDTFKNLIGTQLIPVMQDVTKWIAEAAHWADRFFGITAQGNAKKLADDIKRVEENIIHLNKSTRAATDPDSIVSKQIKSNEKQLAILKEQKKVADELAKSQLKPSNYTLPLGDVSAGSVTPSNVNTYKPTGSDDDKKKETLKKQADSYMGAINQLNMDEFELIEASLISKKELLDSYIADGAIAAEEYRTATLQLEQAAADASYDILFNESEKEKALAEKTAKDKAKYEKNWNKQILQNDMSIARESLALIGDTAKEGSALRIAAMIAEKGVAASQVFMQYEVAAAMAMAQLGPIAGVPVAATMKTQAMISMGLIAAQGVASLASRQGGGDMSGTYQTGGGAHTSNPEMFTDRITGKSYMTGNGNMTPAHQLKQGGSGGGFNLTVNNMGQPMNAEVTDNGIDESGVRQLIMSMTPDIMAKEGGNPSSMFNQSRGTIEKIQPEFN